MMVLHGAFMTIGAMGAVVPELAGTRQVIAAELQGHGHTAEVDRPLSYEQMADDVVALIRHLGIEQADVFGYSMGGGAALQLAMRHPAVVRKLVVASASSTSDGVYPEAWSDIEQITPELFAGTPWKEEYDRVAPNPDAFPTLVEKMKQLDSQPFAWPPDEIRAIAAPTMVVIGDADGTTPEHAVELFRLRGGGVFGDLVGLPSARLAILLGTTHVGLIDRADWLASTRPCRKKGRMNEEDLSRQLSLRRGPLRVRRGFRLCHQQMQLLDLLEDEVLESDRPGR
jgi:pimeloyl-ACP methyl ester carboxylesterase